MRFNNRDPNWIHSAVSVSKEVYPSIPARDIATVETGTGDMVAHVSIQQDEAVIRMNIAGRTYNEAMEARMALANWAGSSHNRTAELEPTHMPGKAYSAILKRITPIENRFTTADVVFLLPRPVLHDIIPSKAERKGTEMIFTTGGTASTQPVFCVQLDSNAVGLKMEVDGVAFFAIEGELNGGAVIEYDLQTGATTINGEHAENRILYADINPDIELMPGKHTLSINTAGSMQVRWRNEWL